METLISFVFETVLDQGKDKVQNAAERQKLKRLQKKLKEKLTEEILERYGNEVYYHDLDNFLTRNQVIQQMILNCCNTSTWRYRSLSQTTQYHVQKFFEEYPQHKIHQQEIYGIMQKYFQVIFEVLNKTDDESVRVVCNIMKELAGELMHEQEALREQTQHLSRQIHELQSPVPHSSNIFHEKAYFQYLIRLYPMESTQTYLSRKIYHKEESGKACTALDMLLVQKKIVVVGEAGFGKTVESIHLLQDSWSDIRTNTLIPVYLPLSEYGDLFQTILDGICLKIGSFCDGNTREIAEEWLKQGRMLLILDGMDDISQDQARSRFISDFNDLTARYCSNYYFVTTRYNRYHAELGEKYSCYLTPLSTEAIYRELRKENIYTHIPDHYAQLFANPFFLSIGKQVLKHHTNPQLFNRSLLFGELFRQLYGEMGTPKSSARRSCLTCSEALMILGQFAFETFSSPAYSLLEFDRKISLLSPHHKAETLDSFVASGLFRITDRVSFSHKLLKEFCAAYYLVNARPLAENQDLYLNLMQQDAWKETFIFASGLFETYAEQDAFLDLIMCHNLPLYVECVSAKNDLLLESPMSNEETAHRLLASILHSYRYMVRHYFAPIQERFDPWGTKENGQEVKIVGALSSDRELYYWLDIGSETEADVVCLNQEDLPDGHQIFEESAKKANRPMCLHFLDMALSGLPQDSGRKIAVDLIKEQLQDIFSQRLLLENDYLLCARVEMCQNRLDELRPLNDIREMQKAVTDDIRKRKADVPNLKGYQRNGVDLFELERILDILHARCVQLSEYLLPGPNQVSEQGWIWETYSKEQLMKRITRFFEWSELSYRTMVEDNFPALKHCFTHYTGAPLQTFVGVQFSEGTAELPRKPIVYYNQMAAESQHDAPVVIKELQKSPDWPTFQSVLRRNEALCSSQGRPAPRVSFCSALVSQFLVSGTRDDNALSEYVYDAILKSLEEVFGPI